MKTHSFKRWIAGLLSAALCLSAFLGLGITKAFAKGEQAEVSLVSFPREGDANYSTTTWGHDDIKLMNGWFFQKESILRFIQWVHITVKYVTVSNPVPW